MATLKSKSEQTKRTTAPMNIYNNEGHLRTLEVISEIAIITYTDISGRITFANEKFCEISGYSLEELSNNDHRLINSGHHSKEFFKDMYLTLNEGKVWRGEICNKRKNGSYYWVDTQIFAITDKNNQTIGHASIRFDITKRKNLEKTVLKLEKLASLGSMAAVVAHEINNPLAIIGMSTRSLLNDERRGSTDIFSRENKINKITQSTNQIAKIIQGLKTISRSGEYEDFFQMDLKLFIEDALSTSISKLKHSGIIFELGEIPDIQIECRPKQLSQILFNLINNAHDAIFCHETRWIKLNFEVDKNLNILILKVIDSGNGLNENIAGKIFTNFFTTKEIGKGTGMGLSISYSIAEEHNGRLYYKKMGANTAFVLEVPLSQENFSRQIRSL